jgi:glutamine---fructose-6-phosphate transaminase (isomerizing)
MAMIDRGFPVVAIAPPGRGTDALRPVLERLHDIGADLLIIGAPDLSGLATVSLPLPPLHDEVLSPITAIIPLQQFAFHLAVLRGLDPDAPRGLAKVTRSW